MRVNFSEIHNKEDFIEGKKYIFLKEMQIRNITFKESVTHYVNLNSLFLCLFRY